MCALLSRSVAAGFIEVLVAPLPEWSPGHGAGGGGAVDWAPVNPKWLEPVTLLSRAILSVLASVIVEQCLVHALCMIRTIASV